MPRFGLLVVLIFIVDPLFIVLVEVIVVFVEVVVFVIERHKSSHTFGFSGLGEGYVDQKCRPHRGHTQN